MGVRDVLLWKRQVRLRVKGRISSLNGAGRARGLAAGAEKGG